MLNIRRDQDGNVILDGRFDASQQTAALEAFKEITDSFTIDCSKLEYISSSGIGVLIATQQRLAQNKQELRLKDLSPHITEIFKYAGLDALFKIE